MPNSSSAEKSRCERLRLLVESLKPTRRAQEFRAELHAAETKDKKFTKRKTVLKKIVANITMGNDSEYVAE